MSECPDVQQLYLTWILTKYYEQINKLTCMIGYLNSSKLFLSFLKARKSEMCKKKKNIGYKMYEVVIVIVIKVRY